jgi:hypothetical protein
MDRLQTIHSQIRLVHGQKTEELEEQVMAALFIEPHCTVLELGGNVGRNSCTIGALLDDSSRLVVVETAEDSVAKLTENRDANQMHFHIEHCAISKEPIYQHKWQSKPASNFGAGIPNGWTEMPTKSWTELKSKYSNLVFDTLVADCEGALFYILKEEPTFLDTIRLVLIENDFTDVPSKQFVDGEFKRYNFERIYYKAYKEWIPFPCKDNFYEAWRRKE